MNFEKDVLRVRMFRNKQALTADILMMLNSHLRELGNYERLISLATRISRRYKRSYLDSYWRYLFKSRMECK